MDRWLKTGSCSKLGADNIEQTVIDSSDDSELEPEPQCSSEESQPKRVRLSQAVGTSKVRKYDASYIKWGFEETTMEGKPGALCVLCERVLKNSSMNPAKLQRHLERKHPEQKNRSRSYFELTARNRSSSQPKLPFEKPCRSEELSLRLSYLIGRAGEAHTIGERLVKPSLMITAQTLLCEKQVRAVQKIPLSNNMVGRRIKDLSNWIEDQVNGELRKTKCWALQLDESTDTSGQAILMVFVRYVCGPEICEELLFCKPLATSTTGGAIFDLVDSYLREHELTLENCINICSDAAAAMTGRRKGFTGRVLDVSPTTTTTHCVIHREALAAKGIEASV